MSRSAGRRAQRNLVAAKIAVMLTVCASLLCLHSSCASQRELSVDECDLGAWFIEDVAHGHARRPEELEVDAPSVEMRRLTAWLSGGTQGRYQAGGARSPEDYHPPGPLAARANRWSNLHALFLAHQVVVLPSGLVAARPDLSADDTIMALPVVDHENLDRRALDALVAGMCAPGSYALRIWLDHAAAARVQLDLQGGAELWQPGARNARAPSTR
jgi:hypothetical protein